MVSLVRPLYDALGFDDLPSDGHLTERTRSLAVGVACRLGYKPCVREARSRFEQWRSENRSLPVNAQSTVLCAGVAEGGEDAWDAVWGRYASAPSAAQQAQLRSALGCAKEVWMLARYLDRAFSASSGIRKQDAASAFGSVAANPIGAPLAWRYLRNHWSRLVQYFGPGSSHLSRLVSSASRTFNSRLELQELQAFEASHAADGGLASAVRSVRQALERTRVGVQWMDAHYEDVLAYLEAAA